jgi:hypothetical protein
LLILVIGGEVVFPVGGGPLISPAAAGVPINRVDSTATITQRVFIDELPSILPEWKSRDSRAGIS